jgi:hypothetical protein
VIGPTHVLAVALVMAGASGCTLLDLLLGSSPGFDPNATFPPFPTAEASFTTGQATIAITGGETVVLDELTGAAGITLDGVHVVWENQDGWYMSFTAYGSEEAFPGDSFLSLDRIMDREHWVVADPSRCITTTTQSGASGVRGTATCRGVRWADYFSAYAGPGFAPPLPSVAPFDAEITFEAH